MINETTSVRSSITLYNMRLRADPHRSQIIHKTSCSISKRGSYERLVLPRERIDAGGQSVPGPRPRSRRARAAPRPRESPRERHADGHIGCIRRTVLSPRPCKARAPTSSTFRAATDLPYMRCAAKTRRLKTGQARATSGGAPQFARAQHASGPTTRWPASAAHSATRSFRAPRSTSQSNGKSHRPQSRRSRTVATRNAPSCCAPRACSTAPSRQNLRAHGCARAANCPTNGAMPATARRLPCPLRAPLIPPPPRPAARRPQGCPTRGCKTCPPCRPRRTRAPRPRARGAAACSPSG
mmetsp:Transcript_36052/g.119418  ORF Transcript_36052/g.119418 Transcript_36052/m.119418 type:complete len:297 (-) Transcript_36052:1679-2569(-)